MDIDNLRVVSAVYTYKSYFEAAYQLSIEYSVLSKKVAKVEKELGVRIFERALRGKQLSLTDEGAKIIYGIQEIVRSYDNLIASVDSLNPKKGNELRVGYWRSNGSFDENVFLKKFFTENYQYTLKRTIAPQDDLCNALYAGKLDFVFVNDLLSFYAENIPSDKYEIVPLAGLSNVYVVVGNNHPLANTECLAKNDFKKLANDSFIFDSRQNAKTPDLILNHLGIRDTAKKIFIDYSDPTIALSLVETGTAVMPAINGEKYMNNDNVHAVKIEGWTRKMMLYLVYPKGLKTHAGENFIKEVYEFYQNKNMEWNK